MMVFVEGTYFYYYYPISIEMGQASKKQDQDDDVNIIKTKYIFKKLQSTIVGYTSYLCESFGFEKNPMVWYEQS